MYFAAERTGSGREHQRRYAGFFFRVTHVYARTNERRNAKSGGAFAHLRWQKKEKNGIDHAVLSTDGKQRPMRIRLEPDDGLRALYRFCHIKGRNGIAYPTASDLYIRP